MYKKDRFHQFSLADFNQPLGLKMNPENRWVKRAETIPWEAIEDRYAELFPSHTGVPAKPLRVALGSLIIQKYYDYADRELVEQLTENPYYQYFIGLPGYQQEAPFVPSLLVEFRKRLTAEILGEINEMIIDFNNPDDNPPSGGESSSQDKPEENPEEPENKGTLMLDATCAPQNIAFPQDINLLNESRENLETIIDTVCYEYHEPKPRTYRRNARKDYLSLAKRRKRSGKHIRKAIKKQLQYVRRDLKYIDAYNESDVLISAVQRYFERTGHYPERVLADKIYRNRSNLRFCKEHGIRLSGPALGRPRKNSDEDRRTICTDAVDRIEVERKFSLAKRCYGLGLIRTKLDTTTRSSISLSIIAMNVGRLTAFNFCDFLKSIFQGAFDGKLDVSIIKISY